MNITQEGEEQKSLIEQMIPLHRDYNTVVAKIQAMMRSEKSQVEDEMQDIIDERNKEPYCFSVHSEDINEIWTQERLKSKKK